MTKLREASLDELFELAKKCGYACTKQDDYIRIDNRGYEKFDPIRNDKQNHRLLEKVIADGDCKLFYDDGVHEFFIYDFPRGNPPIAHRQNLNEAVFEAALNLWFPEEE